jgi:restriction system protein
MWECEIRHDALNKFRVVKGHTREIMRLRAEMQMRTWNEQWLRTQSTQTKRQKQLQAAYDKGTKKNLAAERTREAKKALEALDTLLADALEEDHAIDWKTLIDESDYPVKVPAQPEGEPVPRQPAIGDPEFDPQLRLLARIIPSLRKKEKERIANKFIEARNLWSDLMSARWRRVEDASERFKKELAAWEAKKSEWLNERESRNLAIEEWRKAYLSGAPESIPDYCKLVLNASGYPESFPNDALVDYIAESRTLVVEYSLPDISALPTLKEVKFIASREALEDMCVSEAWLNRTYDSVLYQIALRSLYELFQADSAKAIDSIVFNGWVNSVDKATGKEVTACILSIHAAKTELMDINLANVEPKACFKKLKGVSAAKLTALQPVRPILQLNRDDKRFVPAHGVADELDGSSNLAAMDWEDFEHLIRELFEEEFSANGGEVKITQASRDGGVDAIVFDPDPIRGGKIVIQAKRYTATVSVSAVRDLFGTIHNEGANKGILVTTADYGPDAYEFAKGKPITLISGSELLYLLAKHGHRARIDLKEARMLAAEQERISRLGNP